MSSDEHRDEDGFPIAREEIAGSLYRDEFEVVYVCEFIEDLGAWGWRTVGPATEE